MLSIIQTILNWSEVWAMLIPLAMMLITRNKTAYLKPVRIFLVLAFLTNCFIVLLAEYKRPMGIREGDFLWNNNFLYNIMSLLRFFLFSWFFILLNQGFMKRVKLFIPIAFVIFLVVNFSLYENFIPRGNYESFSSRLLATESALLLFYCLQYFISLIIEDRTSTIPQQKGFWLITGLSIYVSACFFIYLLYSYLTDAKRNFAINIWDVHNVCFIILCISIAIQFFQDYNKQPEQ